MHGQKQKQQQQQKQKQKQKQTQKNEQKHNSDSGSSSGSDSSSDSDSDSDSTEGMVYDDDGDDGRNRILEIGYGKGANSLYLAEMFRDLQVTGIDVTDDHRAYASRQASRLGLSDRVDFFVGDAANPPEQAWRMSYNMIFGVESFCHFDDAEQRERVALFCATKLKPNGKLVIVDGGRCPSKEFDRKSDAVRRSMRLAEAGFQINAMPSREEWKVVLGRKGLVLEEEIDLSEEAGRFWIGWWKIAHVILNCAPQGLLCRVRDAVPSTFDNFIAVCMAGYAFHHGAARYGALVFRKKKKNSTIRTTAGRTGGRRPRAKTKTKTNEKED